MQGKQFFLKMDNNMSHLVEHRNARKYHCESSLGTDFNARLKDHYHGESLIEEVVSPLVVSRQPC